MGQSSSTFSRESLKPGDHVYYWKRGMTYAHHGIYVGDDTVIHFTGHGPKPEFPRSLNKDGFGIISSCLDDFLAGGKLRRFEYGVSPSIFLAKVRGGTCTMAESDPDEEVIHRAKYLLANGFTSYNLFKSNCENFAVYCKTGLVLKADGTKGQSGQVHSMMYVTPSVLVSAFNGFFVAVAAIILELSVPLLLTGVGVVVPLSAAAVYCLIRYGNDIGKRGDFVKVPVEDLKTFVIDPTSYRPPPPPAFRDRNMRTSFSHQENMFPSRMPGEIGNPHAFGSSSLHHFQNFPSSGLRI